MTCTRTKALGATTAMWVAALGCAQWQQGADDWASMLDRNVAAECARVLGDESATSHDAPKATTIADRETPRRAPHRDAAVRQAVAELKKTGPTPAQPRPEVAHALAAAPGASDACCDAPPAWLLGRSDAGIACGACEACRLGGECRVLSKPEAGPPPIRYRPVLPPKFLPVPTEPTLSPARHDAPDPWRGDVELGFRPQVMFPGRD